MAKPSRSSQSLAKSPILWGALICGGFYGLISLGIVKSELVNWVFASHPVEYVATTMFFIGLAALAIKLADIADQRRGLARPLLARSRRADNR